MYGRRLPPHVYTPEILTGMTQRLGHDPRVAGQSPSPSGAPGSEANLPALNMVHRKFTLSTTSELISPYTPDREYLFIQNIGTVAAWIGVGALPSIGDGVEIPVGGYWEPWRVPASALYGIGSATSNICVVVA